MSSHQRVRQLSLVPDPIDEAFLAFHHAHPEVYARLVAMARRWKAAGHETVGIKMFFEVLRWERGLSRDRDQGEEFLLNNNFSSRYSRLIMANEPDLAGMFKTRQLLAS